VKLSAAGIREGVKMNRNSDKSVACRQMGRSLLKAPDEWILSLDVSGTVLSVVIPPDNRLLLSRKGVLSRRQLKEIFTESAASELAKALREAQEHTTSIKVSIPLRSTQGQRCYEVLITPQAGQGERPERFVALFRDRTESDKQDPFRQAFETLIRQSREGVMILSSSWNTPLYNHTFLELLGIAVDQEQPEGIESLVEHIDAAGYERLWRAYAEREPLTLQVNVRSSDPKKRQRIKMVLEPYGKKSTQKDFWILRAVPLEDQHSSMDSCSGISYDPLTGLPNRLMLLNQIEQSLQRCLRQQQIGALFFIDLDNFKEINDTMGHAAGDAVLMECAQRVKSVIRKSDTFGRLGGDEFLLIAEGIKGPDSLMHIAQKIIQVINKPFRINGYEYRLGASVGIATFPQDSMDGKALLRCADLAMYRAKKSGKNRYHFYSERLDKEVRRHATIQQALRYALDHDKFYLVYQPQIDLNSERLIGLEVLLRIDDSIAGPLLPSEFIPIAEESDLILHIGRWVFRHCCQQIRQWSVIYSLQGLRVSINLSQRQLTDPQWVAYVEEQLKRYGIDPSLIEFEITETAFISSKDVGYRTIRGLQKLGCKIAIDDFGTGYSSLSTLKEFTIDKLKIDKSFIDDIVKNSIDRTIVKASIAMAQALGLSTIAEGVETDDQKRLIKMLGCSQVQGFLYSEPKKADEILQCLESFRQLRKVY